MTQVVVDITMSLDGYVAGPNATLEEPLGRGGERLHDWITGLASWREAHGLEGGETSPDSEVVAEQVASTGAYVMGRRMFSGGAGPWDDDPNRDAWWGDEPPFHAPVFVVTHHPREPVKKEGGTTFTFVTDAVEAAVEQARAAAGGRDVQVSGGADIVRQALGAGLVDVLRLHVAPLLLGGGVRLFDGLGDTPPGVELDDVISSPAVTHLRYRVTP